MPASIADIEFCLFHLEPHRRPRTRVNWKSKAQQREALALKFDQDIPKQTLQQ
jgi:hypothetical protein